MFNLRIFAIKKAVSKFADLVRAGKNKWTLMLTKRSAHGLCMLGRALFERNWEATSQRWSPRGRTWPRSPRSSKIAPSLARGQHCFLNR